MSPGPAIGVPTEGVTLLEQVYFETLKLRSGNHPTLRPFDGGQLLAGMVQSVARSRLLDVGCGIGYSTLRLARSTPVPIDAVEADARLALRAREIFVEAGIADRVTLVEGEVSGVLTRLNGGYDFALLQVWPLGPDDLNQMARIVRKGGIMVGTMLYEGGVLPDEARWRTRKVGGMLPLTISTRL